MSPTRRSDFSEMNDRSFQTCSTFLPSDNTPNPVYHQVDDLWMAVHDNDVMDGIAGVVEKFVVDGELDEVAFLEYVELHFGEGLDGLIDTYMDGKSVETIMPPAPSPKILYNRVADCDVVDIGSGDCEKLKRCQAKVTAVDCEVVENPHYVVNKLDCNIELLDFMEQRPGAIVTSFNSLSQLHNVGQVVQYDGLHVVPDIKHVKKIATLGADEYGDYWGKFKDRDNGLAGDVITEGYLGVNTYAERRIRFKPVRRTKIDCDLLPQCEDIYYRPIGYTSTPKYDGECMFLVSKGGSYFLISRDKTGYRLTSGGAPDMVLMLEKLPRVGKPEAFCILRVMDYNGYYPFHGYQNLWNFFKNVNVRIGGVRLYPPGHSDLARFDTDGEIFRMGQLDFRFKTHLTVDIPDPMALIKSLESKCGYVIDCPDPHDGLCEYELQTSGNGSYRLVYVRDRPDKTNATSVDKIARMLQWV